MRIDLNFGGAEADAELGEQDPRPDADADADDMNKKYFFLAAVAGHQMSTYLAWLYANTDADGMINKKIKYN